MKKILLIISLLILACTLTGCATVTDENGVERSIQFGLVILDKVSGNGDFEICYDPTTKVCYMKILAGHGICLSPYYIIGNDGKPEIAVYGVNYK